MTVPRPNPSLDPEYEKLFALYIQYDEPDPTGRHEECKENVMRSTIVGVERKRRIACNGYLPDTGPRPVKRRVEDEELRKEIPISKKLRMTPATDTPAPNDSDMDWTPQFHSCGMLPVVIEPVDFGYALGFAFESAHDQSVSEKPLTTKDHNKPTSKEPRNWSNLIAFVSTFIESYANSHESPNVETPEASVPPPQPYYRHRPPFSQYIQTQPQPIIPPISSTARHRSKQDTYRVPAPTSVPQPSQTRQPLQPLPPPPPPTLTHVFVAPHKNVMRLLVHSPCQRRKVLKEETSPDLGKMQITLKGSPPPKRFASLGPEDMEMD